MCVAFRDPGDIICPVADDATCVVADAESANRQCNHDDSDSGWCQMMNELEAKWDELNEQLNEWQRTTAPPAPATNDNVVM